MLIIGQQDLIHNLIILNFNKVIENKELLCFIKNLHGWYSMDVFHIIANLKLCNDWKHENCLCPLAKMVFNSIYQIFIDNLTFRPIIQSIHYKDKKYQSHLNTTSRQKFHYQLCHMVFCYSKSILKSKSNYKWFEVC